MWMSPEEDSRPIQQFMSDSLKWQADIEKQHMEDLNVWKFMELPLKQSKKHIPLTHLLLSTVSLLRGLEVWSSQETSSWEAN